MSRWRPATSTVPWRVVLGLIFFNIFVSYMTVGLGTLSASLQTAPNCMVLERRDAIQRDLDRLEKWVHTSLMYLNKAKCSIRT